MGAWGEGNFDNDDAGDWVYDFEDQGAEAAETALRAVIEARAEGYVEAPDGSMALAAAEVVAAAIGKPAVKLPEEVATACSKHASAVAAIEGIQARAVEAIAAVEGENSELAELWEEDGPNPDWRGVIADLKDRLT